MGVRGKVGWKWRFLSHHIGDSGPEISMRNQGRFDELVVDNWLHIEQMNDRDWWMRVGDAWIWIHVPSRGDARVTIRRGEYGQMSGETE